MAAIPPQDRMAYALALNVATSLQQMPVKLNWAFVGDSIAKLMHGEAPLLSSSEYAEEMQKLQQALQKAETEQQGAAAAEAEAKEKAYLEQNGKRDGVITTTSGLQYEILTSGSGAKPGRTDTVKVHYEGRLLDGTVFDSSIRRGEPAEFPVNQVISGWTEALQLMNVGSKYRLHIPADLAYGARGAGQAIPPFATLVFDVELLDILK